MGYGRYRDGIRSGAGHRMAAQEHRFRPRDGAEQGSPGEIGWADNQEHFAVGHGTGLARGKPAEERVLASDVEPPGAEPAEGTAARIRGQVGRIHLSVSSFCCPRSWRLTLLRHRWWGRTHLLVLSHRSIEISIHMLQLGYTVSGARE
jgi:hypothetical protein